MYEALYYRVVDTDKKIVQCQLCPHNCIIKDNMHGYCGSRKNLAAKLYCLSYGQITGQQLDPIEKKPLYHFYPNTKIFSIGSWGCNMHCQFCQNFHLSQEYKKYANYQTVSPKELIDYVNNIKNNIGIAFTYNEPFISYEFIRDCLPFIKRTKLKVVLVSNGMINLGPLTKIINEIDAFNIDLKAFTNSFYQKHGGMLDSIKQTISAIVLAKKHIELTLLVIPGENDSEVDMEKMAKWISDLSPNIPLHLSRYFPLYKMANNSTMTPISTLKKLAVIAKKYLTNVHLGNC